MKNQLLLSLIFTSIVSANSDDECNLLYLSVVLLGLLVIALSYGVWELKKKAQQIEKESKEKEQLLVQQNKLIAVGEMMGNIAHQWKQPLNNISILVLNIENAHRKEQLSSEYLENKVFAIEDTIEYMAQTIEDFSDFLSPTKEKKRFYINDSVEKAIELTMPNLNRNRIDIIFLDDDEYEIIGRKSELIQVIMVIINNAKDALIKDTTNSQKEISINLSQEGEYICLTIGDNGKGIPEDIIEDIFKPYFSTNTTGKGRGLGLYMAKMIIEAVNGTIEVSNHNGAVFQIKFLYSEQL